MTWNTYEELQYIIEEDNNAVNSNALYNSMYDHMDYTLEYAEDRVKQLYKHMDNKMYSDSLSTCEYINQQVKTKNELLSGEEGASYTSHLEKLANYVLFCSYDNQQDRKNTENLKEEQRENRKIKDKDVRERKKFANRDKQKTRPSLLSNSRPTRAKVRISSLESFGRNALGEDVELELHSDGYDKVIYSSKDKYLTSNKTFKNELEYWLHFGRHNQLGDSFPSSFRVDYSKPYWEYSFENIKQMTEGLERTKGLEFRKKFSNDEKKIFQKTKKELAEDLNYSIDALRMPMRESSSIPMTTVDPMLEFEEKIDYTSKPVLKEIVYNYAELKQKYGSKPASLYWDILLDFEKAHEHIALSSMQKTIIAYITSTSQWSYNEVIDEVEKEHYKKVSKQSINQHIDGYLNKLLLFAVEKANNLK